MRAHGATNLRYTWQMTGWSFRTSRSDRIAAWRWYPGDRYVKVVGPDEYNWFTCGEGQGNWVSLGKLARPALRFAAVHHKKLAIPEFASYKSGDRRARWVRSDTRSSGTIATGLSRSSTSSSTPPTVPTGTAGGS